MVGAIVFYALQTFIVSMECKSNVLSSQGGGKANLMFYINLPIFEILHSEGEGHAFDSTYCNRIYSRGWNFFRILSVWMQSLKQTCRGVFHLVFQRSHMQRVCGNNRKKG